MTYDWKAWYYPANDTQYCDAEGNFTAYNFLEKGKIKRNVVLNVKNFERPGFYVYSDNKNECYGIAGYSNHALDEGHAKNIARRFAEWYNEPNARIVPIDLSKDCYEYLQKDQREYDWARACGLWCKFNLRKGDYVKVKSGRSPYKYVHDIGELKQFTDIAQPDRMEMTCIALSVKGRQVKDPVRERITTNYSQNSVSSLVAVWRDGEWKSMKKLVEAYL